VHNIVLYCNLVAGTVIMLKWPRVQFPRILATTLSQKIILNSLLWCSRMLIWCAKHLLGFSSCLSWSFFPNICFWMPSTSLGHPRSYNQNLDQILSTFHCQTLFSCISIENSGFWSIRLGSSKIYIHCF
jgi:hypothetical protein